MSHLLSQLFRREGKLLLHSECLKELAYLRLMLKRTILICLEELVEVESVVYGVALVKFHPLLHLFTHDVAHAISKKVQAGHILIRVMVVACPFCFGLLLVGIAPVEYLTVAELPRCDGLERCAAEIKREPPLYVVEGAVGAHRVHALVALIDNQQVPAQLLDPFQLVVSASEIDGAFQPLQALEAYLPCKVLARLSPPFQEHIPCHHACTAPQRIVVAHKAVARLPRHEFLVVVVPRVGYRRAVGDYQHILRLHLPYQVVGREGLAEARLGVPQELALAAVGLKVGFCHVHGILLFAA